LTALRKPRYQGLTALMLLIGAACVGLGTWQIARLHQDEHENSRLRTNAHHAVVPVGDLLTVGATPAKNAIAFRPVSATGVYDGAHQLLVRQRAIGDDTGYLVLTPLRMSSATVLVVRGFIDDNGAPNVVSPSPPTGTVSVVMRLQPGETAAEKIGAVPAGQVDSINPAAQAARLRTFVLDGFGELVADAPGTAGLVAIPPPDLTNPAGGAAEWQHLAYVIQWYLFAGLAFAAPFVIVRAEGRQTHTGQWRVDRREIDDVDEPDDRPALEAAEPGGELVRAQESAQERIARLADRYGR
jgi:cytochrome oxidase assembly protein ShyY1